MSREDSVPAPHGRSDPSSTLSVDPSRKCGGASTEVADSALVDGSQNETLLYKRIDFMVDIIFSAAPLQKNPTGASVIVRPTWYCRKRYVCQ